MPQPSSAKLADTTPCSIAAVRSSRSMRAARNPPARGISPRSRAIRKVALPHARHGGRALTDGVEFAVAESHVESAVGPHRWGGHGVMGIIVGEAPLEGAVGREGEELVVANVDDAVSAHRWRGKTH